MVTDKVSAFHYICVINCVLYSRLLMVIYYTPSYNIMIRMLAFKTKACVQIQSTPSAVMVSSKVSSNKGCFWTICSLLLLLTLCVKKNIVLCPLLTVTKWCNPCHSYVLWETIGEGNFLFNQRIFSLMTNLYKMLGNFNTLVVIAPLLPILM